MIPRGDIVTASPSYLREVGFPDNVLEARVARISAYRSLHSSHAPLSPDSRSDSPKPQVGWWAPIRTIVKL